MSRNRDAQDMYVYLGALLSVPAFLASWWFFVTEFGLLMGLAFGWLAALIVAAAFSLIWPLSLPIALLWAIDSDAVGDSPFWALVAQIGVWQGVAICLALIGVAVSALAHGGVALSDWANQSKARRLAIAGVFPTFVICLFLIGGSL